MSWGATTSGFGDVKARMVAIRGISDPDVMQTALIAGGQPIAATARTLVRERTGELARSIDVGTELSAGQAAVSGDAPTAFVGPGSHTEAITEEFGTLHERPHPYMRPAWEQEQNAAVDAIVDSLSGEFDQRAGE